MSHTRLRRRTHPRSPALLPAPPGLLAPAALSSIGSDSSECSGEDHGPFRIKKDVYSTAKATGEYPQLAGRCLYVVGSYQHAADKREALYPQWNGQTQTGDPTHAVIGTGSHAPVAGVTGTHDRLDFTRW